METVDDQLEQFEMGFRDHVFAHLVTGIDRLQWEEIDELSIENRAFIPTLIRYSLNTLFMKYKTPKINKILEDLYVILHHSAVAALNVPFPRNYIVHIEYVIDNLMRIYVLTAYAPLRTEMIMANHAASIIQRCWRRCVSDPSYDICRRRLVNEFKNLTEK
jgi:hypothetical protein